MFRARRSLRSLNQPCVFSISLLPKLTYFVTRTQVHRDLLLYSLPGLQDRLREEKSKEAKDEALIDDIDTALQFISEDFGDTVRQAEALVNCGEIAFDLLWILFPPNTAIYHYHDYTEQDRVLLCRGLTYDFDYDKNERFAALDCQIISSDGSSFGIAKEQLVIPIFEGSCKIVDLPVYPLKYHGRKDTLRASAISRGKKFAHVSRQCFDTSGPAIVHNENRLTPDSPKFEKHHVSLGSSSLGYVSNLMTGSVMGVL